MAQNYILLERIELTATAASVTFSSIPQSGYTDLKVVSSVLSTSTSGVGSVYMTMAFNGVTTNRTFRRIYGVGTTIGSDSGSLAQAGSVNTSAASSSIFSSHEFYIPNYTSSNFKSISIDTVAEANSASNEIDVMAGLWSATSAINEISFALSSGNFAANSTFSIYGLAAVGTTPVIAPKAIGGNIQTDGTYWYHTFLASGTFTPDSNLAVDYLVVGGGGAGGKGTPGLCWGGAGGAGGIQFGNTSLTTTSYSVVIGAGGSGSSSAGVSGTNGVATTAFSLTAGAGNGGAGNSGNGGSSGTPQSNAGKTGSNVPGGGGGGANQVATTAAGGNGIGGTSYTNYTILNSMGAATNTGQLSSGNYYYGGGGSSGNNAGSNVPGGLGGGGNGAEAGNQPGSGTPNTGGGGGAMRGDDGFTAGNGGSGLVIVRYAV